MTPRRPGRASWRRPRPWSEPQADGPRALLAAGEDRILVTSLEGPVLRLQVLPAGEAPSDFSWSVVERRAAGAPLRSGATAGGWVLSSPEVSIGIDRRTGALSFAGPDGPVFLRTLPRGGVAWSAGRRRIAFEYPEGEMTFGFGEKAGRMDKRGALLRMWNTDSFLYDRLSDPLYMSIPFWTGLRDGRAHGVFLDDPWPLVADVGAHEPGVFEVTAEGGALDLYVIPGPDPKDVLRRYTLLTGRPFLPPLWALGFQICRFSYFPDARVRELARQLRERRIPCDVLYLDIHYMDGFRSFTWDPARFPDPGRLLEDLHAQGFRVITIIDPGLKVEENHPPFQSGVAGGHFVRTPADALATGRVWPGACAFPDFTNAAARAWWGDLYRGLVLSGVDGFWNDMNEPSVFGGPSGTLPPDVRHESDAGPCEHRAVHNVYGQLMAQATREGLERLCPGKRPFVLTRAGGAGVQRVAAGWSGDNRSSWEDFRLSIPMALNMAASGQPLFGPDLGGFGGSPSPELYTRWLQAGAFLGLMRVHSCFGTPDQEPWAFGPEWEDRNRTAIETRYRLLPYLYSLFHEAARGGSPPVRPLWMEWPESASLARREDLFMLGPSLLVAPVLEPGQRWRRIPLPPGRWSVFPEGTPLRRRPEVSVEAPLDRIPVLVRAGAIVPWPEPVQHTGAPADPSLRILVFAGGDGSFTLFEDGGDGPAEGGPVRATEIRLSGSASKTVLEVVPSATAVPSAWREFRFEVHGLAGKPFSVTMAGGDPAAIPWKSDEGAWAWEDDPPVLLLRTPVTAAPSRFEIATGPWLEPPAILEAPRDRALGSEVDQEALVLEPPHHVVAVDWWETKPLRAVVLAAWGPDRLLVACEVEDPDPGEPSFNAQDDGLSLAFRLPGGGSAAPRRFHAGTPEDGGRCTVHHDQQWVAEPAVEVSVQREGGITSWSVVLPAAVLGLEAFQEDLLLDFDLAVQLSDARRRRGVLEWVQGFSAPEEPGGHLHLRR